ncbi:MAG TPA: hypothetical protein VNT55_11740 [Baekduia sp.]|nr:hypothetical protein [Baekduia sp.]
MGENVVVDALLRDPSAAEVTEGLERNPGSQRLMERGWQPLWFEVRIAVGENDELIHSLVWREPGRDADDVAREELGHALEEALRNLRDMEGYDVWPEDVASPSVRVEVS